MMHRRSFIAAGAALGLTGRVGSAMAHDASGPAVAVDAMKLVHPQLLPALQAQLHSSGNGGDLSDASLAAMRSTLAGWERPILPDVPVTERQIPGPRGASDVHVYVVGQKGDSPKPAVLHMHGGGYVLGSPRLDLRPLQELVRDLDCLAVTVDYRLAPETRFPDSLEENYAALAWMHRHATDLGIDPARIALKGESAGGGHAAMLAIAARDRREFPLCYQMLIYPMLDDRTGSSREPPSHIGTFVWTRGDNRYGWKSLLGRKPGGASVPYGSVPARIGNLAGLPPTFIGVGAIDLFVDEDIDYARRLVAAGIPTELHVVPGAYHAFDLLAADSPIARQFETAWRAALRSALHPAA